MINPNTPMIGKDISFKDIDGEALRISDFIPIAMIENGIIKELSVNLSYATLQVESPKLAQKSYMSVINKIDFRNLWSVFKVRGVSTQEEVIIFCVPFFWNKLLSFVIKSMPILHLKVYPRGHLEQIYDPNYKPENLREWYKPIVEYSPKYHK